MLNLFCCFSVILSPVAITLIVLLIIRLTKKKENTIPYAYPQQITSAYPQQYRNEPTYYVNQGEKYVADLLSVLLNWEYRVINDILVKNGEQMAQIDHIIVSIHGIFIIETKDFRGTIHGNDINPYWTQKLGRQTYEFLNPIHQNNGHVKAVKQILGDYPNAPIYSFIVFTPRCQLNIQNQQPSQSTVLYSTNLINTLGIYKNVCIITDTLNEICHRIEAADIGTEENRRIHIEMIKDKIQTRDEKIANDICPNCGNKLVTRNGDQNTFKACSNYPYCKFTCNIK